LAAEQQRWFLWLPVAFGLGIAVYFQLPGEPPLLACLLPLPAAVLLARFNRRGVLSILITSFLVAAAGGLAAVKLRVEMARAPVLEKQMRGVELRGWVEYVEPRAAGGQRLTIVVASLAALPPARRPIRARVTTRHVDKSLRPGDAITIKATLGPPGIPALPGGYDFARYAWFKQLGAVGYTRAGARRVAAGGAAGVAAGGAVGHDHDAGIGRPPLRLRLSAAIQSFRQRIGRRIDNVLPGQVAAISKALITGERGGISAVTNDAFRASGLVHILSISGLHMAIMAGAIFFLIRLLLAMIPAIALSRPIKKWGAFAAALGALGYLTISGGTFATVRSYVMISIMFFAILLDRPALALRNVALAALVILVLFPESILDVGFQMSFAAVVALVAAYEAIRDRHVSRRIEQQGRWQKTGRLHSAALMLGGIILTTLIASAAVAPFAAYHFHKSQQYAVLANLIAVPICNIVVMPAALATFIAMPFGLEAGPLWVMGKGVEGMMWCARTVAALPGAVGFLPQIPAAALALMIAGGLWLTLWRQRWRLLGLLAILSGLMIAPRLRPPDLLVGGQGRLIAVRTGGRLSALPVRGSRYQLSRWLEADGDSRDARAAMSGAGFICDSIGCTARVKGRLIAIARHPAALRDDCRHADIVVTTLRLPQWCRGQGLRRKILFAAPANGKAAVVQAPAGGRAAASSGGASVPAPAAPALVIDRFALRRNGTFALRINKQATDIDWVAAHRGQRPWSMPRR